MTLEEVEATFKPGRVVAVRYVKRDEVADLIAEAEGSIDEATHALCCMGGLDIVEATAVGVSETNLKNYLRGNCILTVREAPVPTREDQAHLATSFWSQRVLDPYDWGMIIGTIPIAIVRHVVGLFSRGLADRICRKMPNLLASNSLSTCAELAVRGVRKFYPGCLASFVISDVEPRDLRIDPSLNTVAVLNALVFEER